MESSLRSYIHQLLIEQAGPSSNSLKFTRVGGGSINDAWQVSLGNAVFFCKINSATKFPGLFQKEADGLRALHSTSCIVTPRVTGVYQWQDQQILLMEWIESGTRAMPFWKKFGEQLAALHSWIDPSQPKEYFGYPFNNYMGALPQCNTPQDNWNDFFRDQRLQPQLELACSNGLIRPSLVNSFDRVYRRLPDIFGPATPSFLHGDLWSGNFLCSSLSEPVLIDPAVYYGHRSMDLAMTTLFGKFDDDFYEAYNYWSPLPSNASVQWEVCNLYPLLIHLNLFGSSYLSSIESVVQRFQ